MVQPHPRSSDHPEPPGPGLRALTSEMLRGSTVLLRVDHNVPLTLSGTVADDTRLLRTLPTIEQLLEGGARVILLSHWGYPGGRYDPRLSTASLAEHLGRHSGRPVRFCPSADPHVISSHLSTLRAGELLYAENLRFLPGEEANAASLAEGWRALADLYVSDAFSVCHRRHASVAALPERLPAFAGASFVHEHRHLRDVLAAPRPRALVLGGAKVQQKMAELPALARSFDLIALGGLCAVHAAAALGTLPPLQDARALPPAGALAGLPAELLVPHDWRVVREGRCETLESDRVPDPAAIADVGPGSMEGLLARLASCRAIFWNGPLGRYETDEGFGATAALAAACVGFGRAGAQVAVGGGDTVAAVQATASAGRIGFVSAAGGAALAYMARGDELPGIRPLVLRGASSPAAPASLAGES